MIFDFSPYTLKKFNFAEILKFRIPFCRGALGLSALD